MKNFIYVLIMGVVFVTIAGCAQISPQPEKFEIVTIPGSGDSQDLLRELARSYRAQYPDRDVVIPDSVSTDGGIKAVGTAASLIARVARLPNSKERAQYGEFKYLQFARVPVVFVVSPDAGVSDLSERQICDIFSGRITNWKEVGGPHLSIAVQSRPDFGSNMLKIRKKIACFADLQVTPRAHHNFRNANLVESMKISSGAIGFMPLSEAKLNGFTTVTLDGVAPVRSNYKLGIGLGFVYKKPFSSSIQAFVDYLKTDPAREIMRQMGNIPDWRNASSSHREAHLKSPSK